MPTMPNSPVLYPSGKPSRSMAAIGILRTPPPAEWPTAPVIPAAAAFEWEMDNDYVMFLNPEAGIGRGTGAAYRRAEAMRQWIRLHADVNYLSALEHVRDAERRQCPTWRAFDDAHKGVAQYVRVAEGEILTDAPLSSNFDRRAVVVPEGPAADVIAALVRLDVDGLMRQIQPFDPLSWHCYHRRHQHEWFCRHAADPSVWQIPPRPAVGGGSTGSVGWKPALQTTNRR